MVQTLTRRKVIKGIVTGVPLAVVLADPLLARAAAEGLEVVTITTDGGRKVSAVVALPAKTPAPAILLVHEWWGLNDQIKAVAAELAGEGYVALAVDMYGGKVANTSDEARAYMKTVDPAEGTDIVASWARWLKNHAKGTGKLATIGWCFGGGWSLNASIAEPADATVIYYGRVTQPAADLKRLKGPVLGHFATQDKWINRKMVGDFETEMKAAGKSFTNHWYQADHAFANPTGARYDQGDAKLAWQRTLKFFRAHL